MKKVIVIENRGGHDGNLSGGHYGNFALVWASRPEIIKVTVKEDRHEFNEGRINFHNDFIAVEVELTEAFDDDKDFVIVEHKVEKNPFIYTSGRERYELIAGKMPAWASFPEKWQKWVLAVREDAINFLNRKFKNNSVIVDAVWNAQLKSSKSNIIWAWEEVAKLVESATNKKLKPILPTESWTAVEAMPIRIAQQIGWRPPVPRPKFQKREGNAVLVASPEKVRAGNF